MNEAQTLQITLDPNGVAAPAHRVVALASQVVATALRALANDDLSSPEMQGHQWEYQFNTHEMNDEERRVAFDNWILSKGFQDLARGVRETLEEAVFYLSIFDMNAEVTTLSKVQEEMSSIRAEAAKIQFPELMKKVNARLTTPMAFDVEFLSLQKVRNCLEHRGGRVGARDVDSTGTMTLSFPRLRAFYRRGDTEVELVPGEIVDTHASGGPIQSNETVQILMNRVTRTRTYALNEPVVVSASEFFEIAMACVLFASDVASKLPVLPPKQGAPGAAN